MKIINSAYFHTSIKQFLPTQILMGKTLKAMDATTQTVIKKLEVSNKMGIHARPAAMIVRIANKYNDTEIWVDKNDEQINGKSIMGLMMLAAGYRSFLTFTAKGPDAHKLIEEIEDLFNRKFEEG